MLIRPLQRPDHKAWLRLRQAYDTFYNRTIPPAVLDYTWERLLDPAKAMHGFVAEQEGQIFGFVHCLFHDNTSTLHQVCYLQDLFVDPSFRGKGAGRALIEAIYKKARENKAPRVYWLTHETNTQAMALYNQVASPSGFIQYVHHLPSSSAGQ
jgi:GNAT superfamily N-acetyltransferase